MRNFMKVLIITAFVTQSSECLAQQIKTDQLTQTVSPACAISGEEQSYYEFLLSQLAAAKEAEELARKKYEEAKDSVIKKLIAGYKGEPPKLDGKPPSAESVWGWLFNSCFGTYSQCTSPNFGGPLDKPPFPGQFVDSSQQIACNLMGQYASGFGLSYKDFMALIRGLILARDNWFQARFKVEEWQKQIDAFLEKACGNTTSLPDQVSVMGEDVINP